MIRSLLVGLLLTTIIFASADSFAAESNATSLRVATFESDVTIPLGERLYSKPLVAVDQPLQAKGIVLDDGGGRYVLCTVDWCTMRNATHLLFRAKLAEAVGTDVARVAVHCVHLHTAPSYDGQAQELFNKQKDPVKIRDLEFLAKCVDRLADAARGSLERLEPFGQIGTGRAKVDRVASNRRIPTGDGKVRWRGSACRNAELRAAPEGIIDPYLKTITLARAGKPLVRLHYYATHPQSRYGEGHAGIDTAGTARQRLEKKEGVFQIYFTGCAGDVAMGKYNDRSLEAKKELTDRLYAGMEASVAATKLTTAKSIEWRVAPVSLPPRTDGKYDPATCRAMLEDTKAKPNDRLWAASRILTGQRLKRPIDLTALKIGDVYILHLPGEPMIEFQLYAQRAKPDAFVAVAGYGLGSPGYVCTEKSFAEGSYEPSASAAKPCAEWIMKAGIDGLLGVK